MTLPNSFPQDSYKRWLCSSSLNLFINTSTIDEPDNSSCSSKPVNISLVNETLMLSKPCLSVCQRVVQSCPYYLPSSFQTDVTNNDTKEVVYGGYPAFDCPSECLCVCRNKNSICWWYPSMFVHLISYTVHHIVLEAAYHTCDRYSSISAT